MFQFPGFPRSALYIQAGVPRLTPWRIAPFGHPRIIAWEPLPEAFRRVPAPFIGPASQGIHRAPIHASSSQSRMAHQRPRRARVDPHHRGRTMEISSLIAATARSTQFDRAMTLRCQRSPRNLERGGEWWCAARCLSRGLPTAIRDPRLRPPRGVVTPADRRGTRGEIRHGPSARALDLGWTTGRRCRRLRSYSLERR